MAHIRVCRVFVGTWNVNGTKPVEPLDAWLVSNDITPDIYCVGLQEAGGPGVWGLWRAAIAKTIEGIGQYNLVKTHKQTALRRPLNFSAFAWC